MDPLFDNLAERFADHAMDVDPGTWSAIVGKLAVASGSSLSGLLQEKFTGHEAPVDPQVWTNISSQLGHGAAAGVGSTAGWWAAGIAATLLAGSFLVYDLNTEADPIAVADKAPIVAPLVQEVQPVAAEPTPDNASIPSVSLATGANSTSSAEPTNASTGQPSTLRNNVPSLSTASEVAQPENETTLPSRNQETIVPAPSPEGEKAVNTVLQKIVDNYVTSPIVVVTEPKVPAPTQDEMPSEAVHPQHDDAEEEGTELSEPEIRPAVQELAVMIPTAFSPNTDGVNDELVVTVRNYQRATVRIFSASSNALVFSADNLEARWNGKVMNVGQSCEPGMYFYALEVTDENGRTWSKGEVVRLFQR